jgi:hypothetical protein
MRFGKCKLYYMDTDKDEISLAAFGFTIHALYYSSSTYMWSRWPSTEFATEIVVKIHLPALLKQLVKVPYSQILLCFPRLKIWLPILSAMRFDILRFPYQI